MRCLIFAIMIVLLPLRGWAADTMATHMASTTIAINTGAARAHETGVTTTLDQKKQAMPDCHEQMLGQPAAGDIASPESSHQANGHCGTTCQACQACHTVALLPDLFGNAAACLSPQLRASCGSAFTSATSALSQKPPIS